MNTTTRKLFDLNDFVGAKDHRDYLRAPFLMDGYTVASNGHILAAITRDIAGVAQLTLHSTDSYRSPWQSAEKMQEGVRSILSKHARITDWRSLPVVDIPEKVTCSKCNGTGNQPSTKCRECDGDGEVELDSGYNTYECECMTCYGSGEEEEAGPCQNCDATGKRFQQETAVDVGGRLINAEYYQRIASIEGVDVAVDQSSHAVLFRQVVNSDVVLLGAVMPLREAPLVLREAGAQL